MEKTISIEREKISILIKFALLMGIVMLAPVFHQQAFTGMMVNATLFLAVYIIGLRGALLLGTIPSLIALANGTLPFVLLSMVPFIIAGNAILATVFHILRIRSFWLGSVCASFLKFIFLFASSSVIADLVLKKEIAKSVLMMMSWPQLFTALAGSVLAYVILKGIKRI